MRPAACTDAEFGSIGCACVKIFWILGAGCGQIWQIVAALDVPSPCVSVCTSMRTLCIGLVGLYIIQLGDPTPAQLYCISTGQSHLCGMYGGVIVKCSVASAGSSLSTGHLQMGLDWLEIVVVKVTSLFTLQGVRFALTADCWLDMKRAHCSFATGGNAMPISPAGVTVGLTIRETIVECSAAQVFGDRAAVATARYGVPVPAYKHLLTAGYLPLAGSIKNDGGFVFLRTL